MARYALINNTGTVVNVVQWDGTDSWHPGDGYTAVATNTGDVGDTYAGGVFTPPSPPALTPQEQADRAIAGGIAITSTGSSGLNGVYACGVSSQANVNAVVTYILLNGTFPGGVSSMPWMDAAGDHHVFPDVDHFKAFATGLANFVAHVALYGDSNGQIGSLPNNHIAIP